MYALLDHFLGLSVSSGNNLSIEHLTLRALLVFFVGTFIMRIQSQFMGINTHFNYMLNFIMGSLLANAITGDSNYFHTLAMCLLLLFLNWIIAMLCFYFGWAERLFRGEADMLVEDGTIIWANMRKNLVTKDELIEAVVKNTNDANLARVQRAYFENDGHITVITKR